MQTDQTLARPAEAARLALRQVIISLPCMYIVIVICSMAQLTIYILNQFLYLNCRDVIREVTLAE